MVHLIRGSDISVSPVRVAGYFRIADNSTKTGALTLFRKTIGNRFGETYGWIDAGSYFDRDSCDEDIGSRPAFDTMMQEAKDGKFDLLVTDSLAHFTPSADETIRCVEELRSLPTPVRVVFLKDGIDSETVHAVAPIVRGWRP